MFSKKKNKCGVCGYRFKPKKEEVYTAEEPPITEQHDADTEESVVAANE